ncbi:hypothetical protein PMAYCL1PPCAC_23562, partial [Pristionchus mayeri]
FFRMAEIGGSPTDASEPNLDNTGNVPGTSNVMSKEGAIKRQSEVVNDATPAKKKKSAEELAGTSKGRNLLVKKHINALKRKRQNECKRTRLLENRDRLLEKLEKLNNRDMEDNDRAEERLVKRQDEFGAALVKCERALANLGACDYNEEEQNILKSLSINLPDWPCLDTYIQDFVLDRLYQDQHREKGTAMKADELADIINKVRSRDQTIKLPNASEMERLLVAINCKISEAVHERRFDDVVMSIGDFPNVDPDAPDTVPDAAFSCPKPLKKVKKEGVEAEREELNELVGRVISACVDADDVSEKDLIILDDEDNEKEADDDEMSDEEEGVEEEEQMKEDEEEEHDVQLVDILKQCGGVKEQTKVDNLPEENPDGKEESTKNESMVEKGEDEEKERPDSRDGKVIMEGGTSTNSPTLERDERIKEIEKIEDIKQKGGRIDSESREEGTDTNGASEKGKDTTDKADIKANLSGNTIVLDDDEDEEEEGWDEEDVKEEEEEDDGIHPPVPQFLTPHEAWRVKLAEIQTWVNKLTPEPEDGGEAKDEVEVIEECARMEEEEKDDEIECIQDDFEMDSVSHSGLPTRRSMGVGKEEKRGVNPVRRSIDYEVEVIELD